MKWILAFSFLSVSCGIKGAPMPRKDSAYIFNPRTKVDMKDLSNEKEETKERRLED